jgi:hypothetical protein
MLKTSPIIDSAPNASPTFRYATSGASPHVSPRHSTSYRRASISRSLDRPAASPGSGQSRSMPPPPSADGGIATQPRTDAAIHAASSSSSFPPHSDDTTTQPPPPPAPKPLTASTGSLHTVGPSNEPVTTGSTSVEPTSALSPNKRRGSPPAPIASLASNDQPNVDSGDIASKRSRHDERPAKILPHQYELCSRDDIVELIAHMVGELITTNDAIRVANGGLTRFHSRYVQTT